MLTHWVALFAERRHAQRSTEVFDIYQWMTLELRKKKNRWASVTMPVRNWVHAVGIIERMITEESEA